MHKPAQTLPTDQISERRFRVLAGLCSKCGKCNQEPGNDHCAICIQKETIADLEHEWRANGEIENL